MPDRDQEIAAYIENLPRHLTFSRIAEQLRCRFGPRAWSRSRIVRYWYTLHPNGRRPVSRLDADPEVRAFVEDRLGRLTLDGVLAECRRRFGPQRTPSKSSLQRHWQKIRRAYLES